MLKRYWYVIMKSQSRQSKSKMIGAGLKLCYLKNKLPNGSGGRRERRMIRVQCSGYNGQGIWYGLSDKSNDDLTSFYILYLFLKHDFI